MEEEVKMEQPIEEQTEALDQAENSVDSEVGSIKNEEHFCEFGKFKSSDELVSAYENLHKEFTRKCQRLSELEKDKTQDNKPCSSDLEEGLSAFLSKNSDAKEYSQEILQKVDVNMGESAFENAWAKIILEKLASQDIEKKNNPIIKKIVFEDENLKNSVIEIYMKELQSNKPPILLKSDKGERATRQDPVAPSSLKEAKMLMEEMFS